MAEAPLNFHHLRYFWAVAAEGNLTRAAKRFRVSQSALSSQIRQLEDQLGQQLFAREGRRLVLTEAGRIAFNHAEEIFATGQELLATLKRGRQRGQVLRVGAVATLSRNFQDSVVKPLLDEPELHLYVQSGTQEELLARLEDHALDLLLSNRPVTTGGNQSWHCRRIARQRVSLVGRPRAKPFRLPADLSGAALIVPGVGSDIRTEFDLLCEQWEVRPKILAEVDDMAMMRLLARDSHAVALLPSVVVRDELQAGVLQEYGVVPGLHESFYAITVERQYPHPLVKRLLARPQSELLDSDR